MQTLRDRIIENFDRGNAEGAALGRQTDQSRAAGAHTFIRFVVNVRVRTMAVR